MTYSVPKQLIPVGGRPVLGHVLSDIASSGIEEAFVITSPESRQAVTDLLNADAHRLKTTVVIQESPDGLAAAFSLALPYIGDEASLLYLGDCLITGGVSHLAEEHRHSSADATILVAEVDDPSRYGIVEDGNEGQITGLVEKPRNPRSNRAIVGVYAFQPVIAEAIRAIEPSARGEYEITDAIQYLVAGGGVVRSSSLRGWWIDTGTVPDVLSAHERMMGVIADRRDGSVTDSELVGPVVIAEGATVRRAKIEGPVIIDSGATVEDSVVGPSSHVGDHARVIGAKVRQSIIMNGAELRHVYVASSIIGPHARISTSSGHSPRLEVVLGADAVVELAESQS